MMPMRLGSTTILWRAPRNTERIAVCPPAASVVEVDRPSRLGSADKAWIPSPFNHSAISVSLAPDIAGCCYPPPAATMMQAFALSAVPSGLRSGGLWMFTTTARGQGYPCMLNCSGSCHTPARAVKRDPLGHKVTTLAPATNGFGFRVPNAALPPPAGRRTGAAGRQARRQRYSVIAMVRIDWIDCFISSTKTSMTARGSMLIHDPSADKSAAMKPLPPTLEHWNEMKRVVTSTRRDRPCRGGRMFVPGFET